MHNETDENSIPSVKCITGMLNEETFLEEIYRLKKTRLEIAKARGSAASELQLQVGESVVVTQQ